MFNRAKEERNKKTFVVSSLDQLKERMNTTQGFAKTMWCGDVECEDKIKEETSATIRCIPFQQEDLGDTCSICGKKAKHMVYLAKAY